MSFKELQSKGGVHFSTSVYSGMQIWHYDGKQWAVFKKAPGERKQFAYCWGKI